MHPGAFAEIPAENLPYIHNIAEVFLINFCKVSCRNYFEIPPGILIEIYPQISFENCPETLTEILAGIFHLFLQLGISAKILS